jgi:Mn-dependent DtxR family transcriptional regulator
MSESSDAVSERVAVRRTVREVVTGDPIDKRQTISEVASRLETSEEIVREELNELERHGFVYLVGDGDDAEVRLP